MDYFVSAASIEPPDADEQYTERLIRLNRLPCYYEPLVAPAQVPVRQRLGLPEAGTLYGCPQSLFKFHPDFDSVLAAIAEGDPDGHIVLIEGKFSFWTNLLRARWAIDYPILLERVIFLPRMSNDRFMALMAHMDVLLDPIHFGSGNTLYEAMVYGTPLVTWRGQFMRGRIVAGAYEQMGLTDAPVADRLEDYAPLALAIGRDTERRRVLRKALLHNAGALIADGHAVRELEVFLDAAVDAAGRGEVLPKGWRPPVQVATLISSRDDSA
jgi:protein O-GlcNAc transferase